MIDPDARLLLFEASALTLLVPEYMKCTSRHVSELFCRPQDGKLQDREAIAAYIYAHDNPATETYYQQQLMIMKDPGLMDTEWLRWRRVRFGQCVLLTGALEQVLELRDLRIGVREYYWHVLWKRNGDVLKLEISGTGDFSLAEPKWSEVVKSVRFGGSWEATQRNEQPSPPARNQEESKSVPTASVDQMREHFVTCPQELHYLIPAVVEAAAYSFEEQLDEETEWPITRSVIQKRVAGLVRVERRRVVREDKQELERWLAASNIKDTPMGHAVYLVICYLGAELLYG